MLTDLGVRMERPSVSDSNRVAFNIFDTTGRIQGEVFGPNSNLAKNGIKAFPPELFFVLRVCQVSRVESSESSESSWASCLSAVRSLVLAEVVKLHLSWLMFIELRGYANQMMIVMRHAQSHPDS
jgi:hypothetical protein